MSTLTKQQEKLKEAEATYELAKTKSSAARRAETDALNKLNEAQREFDKAVDAVRDRAPGGDWKDRKRSFAQAS